MKRWVVSPARPTTRQLEEIPYTTEGDRQLVESLRLLAFWPDDLAKWVLKEMQRRPAVYEDLFSLYLHHTRAY
jgi:hypothetical protein